ncbi:MAG: hypothetical protein WC840_01395 [Candidatus Peribacteraceae bacterium]
MTWNPIEGWKIQDSKEAKKFHKLLNGRPVEAINDSIDEGAYALIGKCISAFQHLENTIVSVISRYFGPTAYSSVEAVLTEVRFSEILGGLRRINKVNELCSHADMETVYNYSKLICEKRNFLVHSYFIGKSNPDGGIQVMHRTKARDKHHVQFGRLERQPLQEFIEETRKLDSFIRYLLLRPPH